MNNNISVQVLNLLFALQMNFLFPFVVGVEYYGDYISITAIAIFVSRIAEAGFDNVILTKYAGSPSLFLPTLLWDVLLPKALFAALAVLPVVFLSGHWEILLLVLAQSASSFFSTWLYARKMHHQLIFFLGAAIILFLGLLLLFVKHEVSLFTAVLLFSGLNVLFAILAACLTLGMPKHVDEIAPSLNFSETVGFVIQSLNASFFSGGFVFLASLFMGGERLGLFRIYTSVVQAATSLFPVNIKIILTNLVLIKEDEEIHERARYLSGILLINAVFLLVIPVALMVEGLLGIPGGRQSIIYIALCPFAYMFLMIMDKVMLAVMGPVKAGLYSFSIVMMVCIIATLPIRLSGFDENHIELIYFRSISFGLLLQAITMLVQARDNSISVAGLLIASLLLSFSYIQIFTLVPLMVAVIAVVGIQVFLYKPRIIDVIRR